MIYEDAISPIIKACPPVLWRAEARPALPVPRPGRDREARLNRFKGTTQVYCLRKDFLELTGKTRSGSGKGADAETVTGGLDLARREKNPTNLGRAIS